MSTSIYDREYLKVNQIVNPNKIKFFEELSDFETLVQLKINILSENNQRIKTSEKKKIKNDLENQIETFDKFYDRFKSCKKYPSEQEAKITQIIFKEYTRKSLK